MATSNNDTIQALYVAYFNRPADPAGLAYWLNVLNTGAGDASTISAAFSKSTEYQTAYAGLNNDNVVATIYQNLFGHAPDTPGLNYWVNLLNNGQVTLAFAVSAIASGAQGTDAQAFSNKVAAADAFTTSLNDNVQARLAYTGDAANAIAKSFLAGVTDAASLAKAIDPTNLATVDTAVINAGTSATSILTTGTDQATGTHIIGSLSTFNADGKGPTLTVGDTVTGSGNDNTLTLADSYNFGNDIIPAGVTIKNIQHVELQTAGNAGGSAGSFDVSAIAGIKTVTVTSAGNATDTVVANGTTDVTVGHGSIFGGSVVSVGGHNVTATTSFGDVLIGATTPGSTPLASQVATGAVTVTQHSTGAGNVQVEGGTTVSITVDQATASGAILVGNINNNVTAATNGVNPTGNVTINDAGTGSTEVFGGANIVIKNTSLQGAGNIIVGDSSGSFASNEATGTVTITETAAKTYDSTMAQGGNINVFGGTDVSVTTNAGGNIYIGNDTPGQINTNPSGNVTVVSTGLVTGSGSADNGSIYVQSAHNVTVTAANSDIHIGYAASGNAAGNPAGAITVTETATGAYFTDSEINIDGGSTVTVNAKGQDVYIGENQASTGNVTVNQSAVLTGYTGYADEGESNGGEVYVGGGANVTVNTTGGFVEIGSSSGGGDVTGAINVTNTFSGAHNDEYMYVYGGTTVNLTVGASDDEIYVGEYNGLNSDGMTLKSPQSIATGNVTIVNDVVVDGVIAAYGTAYTDVIVNGADTVSITGGSVAEVMDVQTKLATAGVNSGKPIGTSTLTTVIIDGNQGGEGAVLTSNALTNLTVTDNATTSSYTVVNTTAGHALNLTVGGNDVTSIVDNTAGSLVVTDNGVAGTGAQQLTATAATSASFANTAAQSFTLTGDVKLATITATNSGSLNLGDLTSDVKLTSIDASGATGSVRASIDSTITGFTGGAGNDTVTINSLALAKNIVGGAGSNTVVVNAVAGLNDVALNSNAKFGGFSTLALGANAGNVAGHTGVYNAGTAAIPAQAQVKTFTFTGAATAAGTVTITINDVIGSYTSGASDSAATIASGLAASLFANGLTGITLGAPGSAAFSVTGNADGTPISVTAYANNITGDSQVTTTPTAGHPATSVVNADGAYDAHGFTALSVGNTASAVTFSHVDAGATLAVTAANANVVNYLLQDATGAADKLAISVGHTSTSTTAVTATVATTGIEALTVNSVGKAENDLTIGDSAAKTVTITGAADLTLHSQNDALTLSHVSYFSGTGGTDVGSITTIDASASSGTVNVVDVHLSSGPAAVHTITGGTGTLIAAGGLAASDIDSITTGTGGGQIVIGAGGSWLGVSGGSDSGAYQAGSETINLSASSGVSDNIYVVDGAVSTQNGAKGGISGFVSGVKNADSLVFEAFGPSVPKTVLANRAVPAVVTSLATAIASATALDSTGALGNVLANLTFTVSNGVITFSATGGHQLSDFTTGQLVSAAEIIVNDATVAGGLNIAYVVAFSTGGSTYVVSDDTGAQLATSGTSHYNHDSLVDLVGVTGVAGFGQTGAANTVVADVNLQASTAANTGSATSLVFDDTGFALHNITGAVTGNSYALNNLAASAIVTVAGTADNLVTISTTQVGAAGSNSLTVEANDIFVKALNATGVAAITLDSTTHAAFDAITDSSNSLTTITADNGTTSLGAVSSTALTSIDFSAVTGSSYIGYTHSAISGTLSGNASALTQDALDISLSGTGFSAVEASGAGVTIHQSATGTGAVSIGADNLTNGAGDVITLGNANSNFVHVLGDGDSITVGHGTGNAVVATGANDIVTVASGTVGGSTSITIGANATINFTGTGAHHNSVVVGDDVTGGTSGAFAQTLINGFTAADNLSFDSTQGYSWNLLGGNVYASQVNVATATTLAQALDIAANFTGLTSEPGSVSKLAGHSGVVDWFQFQGNTYVVEAVNTGNTSATHTALGAHDVVVELTGLVNVNNINHTLV